MIKEYKIKYQALAAAMKPEDVAEAEKVAELCVKTFQKNPHGISFEECYRVLLNFVARRQP